MRNLSADRLYFHCDECERGYYCPEALDIENSFLTLTETYEADAPSLKEIHSCGWAKYAIHEVNE